MADARLMQLDQLMAQHAATNPGYRDFVTKNGITLGGARDPGMMAGDADQSNVDPGIFAGAGQPRAAQFRDQPNAHDTEVAKISELMNQLEASQAADRQHAHSDRARELASRAGQAVSSQMGHLPITEEGPLTPRPSEAGFASQKIKLNDELNNSLFKRENPEDERLMKYLIAKEHNTSTEGIAAGGNETKKTVAGQQIEAKKEADAEKEKNTESRFGRGEAGKDRRQGAGDTTKIAVAEIGAGSNAARGVGEAAARNEYEQAKMGNKRTYDGIKYKAREMVDMNQSNRADHVLETYSMLMPALDELKDMLRSDPRGVAQWGQDARSTLVAAVQQAAEGTTKYNGDGVMNGADQAHAMRQLGSPEAFEQMVTANGGAGLDQFMKTIKLQLHSRLQSLGYEPGEGPDNSLKGAHGRAQAAGSGASSKTPRVGAQDALNAADDALHGKKPTLKEVNPPAQQPQEPVNHDPVDPGERRGQKGKMAKYVPGKGMVME